MGASKGTLISFSTQPGNVALDGTGRNSPYAQAMIKHIGDRGKDLTSILIAVRNDVTGVYVQCAGAMGPLLPDRPILFHRPHSGTHGRRFGTRILGRP